MTPEPERRILAWPKFGLEMAFCQIPSGSFRMGSRGFYDDEEPAHRVKITRSFWLAETPVTQAQFGLWAKAAGIEHKNDFPGNPNHPAENLNWRQANQYCNWLTANPPGNLPEGYSLFCLPTEAEWEYACRARTETEYYSGDGEAALAEAGWFDANSKRATQEVRQKNPNRFGLHDMHGNVYEWCHDIWDDASNRKRLNGVEDPGTRERSEEWLGGLKRMLASEDRRALRGGSWISSAGVCRSAYRIGDGPDGRFGNGGFRVCLVPGPSAAASQPDRGAAEPATEDGGRGTRTESGVAGNFGAYRSLRRPHSRKPINEL